MCWVTGWRVCWVTGVLGERCAGWQVCWVRGALGDTSVFPTGSTKIVYFMYWIFLIISHNTDHAILPSISLHGKSKTQWNKWINKQIDTHLNGVRRKLWISAEESGWAKNSTQCTSLLALLGRSSYWCDSTVTYSRGAASLPTRVASSTKYIWIHTYHHQVKLFMYMCTLCHML